MNIQDEMYSKGFNAGYTFASHNHKICSALSKAKAEKDQHFLRGMKAGAFQYEKEVIAQHKHTSPVWIEWYKRQYQMPLEKTDTESFIALEQKPASQLPKL